MTLSLAERHRLALLGWLATVAMSLSLFPAFEEKRYFLIGAGLSGLVVIVGMALRQLHVPTTVVPLVQLVVAAELLLVGYGGSARYGVVPTSATVRSVRTAVSSGMDVAQRYAAPVPHSPGLTLVAVAFIVLIAVAVDLLAVGLGRAPLAGLPLLALYTVPVASLPHGVPALCFIPGAAAFLALLMVSERKRLEHWGRYVARSSQGYVGAVDTSGLSTSGRRISACALVVAVVLPILVPGFSNTLFHGRSGLGNGNGTGLSFADPMVSLATSLHEHTPVDVLDVTSSTPPSYLRLAVLNEPGPDAWNNSDITLNTIVPVDQPLPAPAGLSSAVSRTPASMTVSLVDGFPRGDSSWLPVPYGMTSLNLDTGGGADPAQLGYVPSDSTVTVRTGGALSKLVDYSVSYDQVNPTAQELAQASPPPADIATRFENVPTGVPAVVGVDARAVTAGATNNYQRALDLQSFFRDRGQFTYDLSAGYGYGYRAMAKFLAARRGYCQHFAATMAMMARELGIPSRVVVGFLTPSRVQPGNRYVFTSHDAHSWPELYFGGVGWVRFEPTPGNGAVIPSYTHVVSVPTVAPTQPTGSQGGQIGHLPTDSASTSAAVAPRGGSRAASGGSALPSKLWLVVVLAIALLLSPGAVRWSVRRSRLARAVDGGTSCEYAWLELRDRVVDLRLPWTGTLTPRARRQVVEPLLGGDPDAVAALDRLSLTVERARYAGSPLAGADPSSDARTVMAALLAETSRWPRVRAFVWPRSLMPQVLSGWSALRSRLVRARPA